MSEDFMKKYLQNAVDDAKKHETFENEIIHQLKTGDRFTQYFQQYDEASVESFITDYAEIKAEWFADVNSFWDLTKSKQSKWYTLAKHVVNSIAKKKVYNQMCYWMMGQATYDGIDICSDWHTWLLNPLYFKDAEPVLQEEIEAYINYINHLSEEVIFSTYTYEHFRSPNFIGIMLELGKDYNDLGDRYSQWFRHYDDVFCIYFDYEKIVERNKKEAFYINYKEELEKKNSPPVPPASPLVHEEHLDYNTMEQWTAKYMKDFEPYDIQLAYEGWHWNRKVSQFTEKVDAIVYTLEEIEERVPVQYNDDWRTGLKIACEMYSRKKIIETIPQAYDEYLYLLQHDLGFEDWIEFKNSNLEHDSQIHKRDILDARKALGEPEDFNF